MKLHQIRPWLIAVFLILFACAGRVQKNDVAEVGRLGISVQEFTYRYSFNPFLFKIKDPQAAKKEVLAALIAEKMLSQEAEKHNKIQPDVKIKIREHEREAMIEELRRDSVEKTIRINDAELQKEYNRSLQEIEAEIFAFNCKANAIEVRRRMLNGEAFGQALAEVLPRSPKAGQAMIHKKLTWPITNAALEAHVYSMKEKQVSPPIFINGKYYLLYVQSVKKIGRASRADFNDRRKALEDHIMRRKIRIKYTAFFRRRLVPALGRLNRKIVYKALNLLAKEIVYSAKKPSRPFAEFHSLPDDVNLAVRSFLPEIASATAVTFPSGKVWNTKALFQKLQYGPYAFDYSGPKRFKESFIKNTELLLEHQAIYQLARAKVYAEKKQVRLESAMWDSYYKAAGYRHYLLAHAGFTAWGDSTVKNKNGLTRIQQERLDFMDRYLSRLLGRYQIKINQDKFKALQPQKLDMVMMKSHFAHRLVAPMLEPLEGLPLWQRKINDLFRTSGIQ